MSLYPNEIYRVIGKYLESPGMSGVFLQGINDHRELKKAIMRRDEEDVPGPVPERPLSINPPGFKILLHFCFLNSYALLRVTFCVIITASCCKGSTVFCNLELHVLRRKNRA